MILPCISRLPSFLFLLGVLLTVFRTGTADAEERLLRIYLDADRSTNFASARSIEMGVRAALSHNDLHPDGVRFEIVAKDHRGNVKRSLKNLMAYENDPDGLVVFGGMHSPPYLTYRDRINESGILLLLPWSAAGPITRTEAPKNWIFRASVDDTKAGAFLATQAVEVSGCTSPAMVLLNSGWGRVNQKTVSQALAMYGLTETPTFFYEGDVQTTMARVLARDVLNAGADCVIFVGVTRGGADIITELAQAPRPIRIFSHWGITGSDFAERTSVATRERVDLQFIQTCLPFGQRENPVVARATNAARTLFADEFASMEELRAPVGFAHGYDLGLLMLAALRSMPLEGSIMELRAALREALETLDEPVDGLMKTYRTPFAAEGLDAHEALGADDLCLARYDEDGRVVFTAAEAVTSN